MRSAGGGGNAVAAEVYAVRAAGWYAVGRQRGGIGRSRRPGWACGRRRGGSGGQAVVPQMVCTRNASPFEGWWGVRGTVPVANSRAFRNDPAGRSDWKHGPGDWKPGHGHRWHRDDNDRTTTTIRHMCFLGFSPTGIPRGGYV